jgi:hypothetical protein
MIGVLCRVQAWLGAAWRGRAGSGQVGHGVVWAFLTTGE